MKVTILQTDIEWLQPEHNQAEANRLISEASGSDLYVLPEMWNTGFITEHLDWAEDANKGSSLEWMRQIAQTHNCAVCGSLAVKTMQGEYRNRQYFILPDGAYYYYDKHHLFSYGGESKCYTAGERRTVATYGGFRFLLLTCYDIRFPLWGRYRDDYDAIIVTANWPESRHNVWQVLLAARAIENQCYVIAANRTGCDPMCSYAGGSVVFNPKGEILMQTKNREQQTLSADIDIDGLRTFHSKFPVLEDRDIFYY